MRVGVICGDRWHPADIVREGLEASLETMGADLAADLSLEYVLDTSDWSNDRLDAWGVAVLCKANARSPEDWAPWLNEDVQSAFRKFVARGGGLLVIHAGTVGYGDQPIFRDLIGGGFVHHPEPGPVTVRSEDNGEIPAVGAHTFAVHDEHYLVDLFRDDLFVFMTSTSSHGTQPAGWLRRVDRGRVCVLTPGHYAPVWQHPDYRRIVAAGLQWCADGYRQAARARETVL